MNKKTILSGIQATGSLTLGNYLGALNNWVEMQEEYDCYYMIADLHTLTIRNNPETLKENTLKLIALYIAAGLNPEKNTIFIQSHVPAHTQLSWILNCYTYMGELNRMTQFKDKSSKHADNINSGLFTYPVLMAADILAYNAQDPMDKILLTDSPDEIRKKFKKAVTDSENCVRFDRESKPGVSNLMSIYGIIKNKTMDEIEKQFEGQGYGAERRSQLRDLLKKKRIKERAPLERGALFLRGIRYSKRT